MIIHITGQNGAGKTTLCNNLAKELNINTIHFDKVNTMEEGKKQYFDFLNNYNNENIILDRFHDGEWVYAPIYRNYTANYLSEIEDKIKNFDYMLIFVKCDINTISKRLDIRGEDYLKPEHYKTEYDNFIDFINKQSLPYITLDTTNKNQKQTFKYAMYYIKLMQNLYNDYKFNKDNYPTGKIDTNDFFNKYKI
jgi:thymidylate kinase